MNMEITFVVGWYFFGVFVQAKVYVGMAWLLRSDDTAKQKVLAM